MNKMSRIMKLVLLFLLASLLISRAEAVNTPTVTQTFPTGTVTQTRTPTPRPTPCNTALKVGKGTSAGCSLNK